MNAGQCRLFWVGSLLCLTVSGGVIAAPASAGARTSYDYEVLLDADSNVATGGPVTIVQGAESPHDETGIDFIVRANVNLAFEATDLMIRPPAPLVVSRTVLGWNGAAFVPVDTAYPVYPVAFVTNGVAAEFGAPLATIGNPGESIRGVFHASIAGVPSNDYTAPFALAAGVHAPALGPGALTLGALLLITFGLISIRRRRAGSVGAVLGAFLMLAGVAWAATIVLDGNVADWQGIAPVVTDPAGDSSIGDPAEDLLAGYAIIQGEDIYFRIDLAAAPQPPPP